MKQTEIQVARIVPIPSGPGIYLEKVEKKMKFSEETERLLTPAMRVEVDALLVSLPAEFPEASINEGVKYTLHLTFKGSFRWHRRAPSQNYFEGKVMGKEQTTFFFVPLFE